MSNLPFPLVTEGFRAMAGAFGMIAREAANRKPAMQYRRAGDSGMFCRSPPSQ